MVPLAVAQAQTTTAAGRLVITAVEADTLPHITLRAYGLRADGAAIDLSRESVSINHGDQTIAQVQVVEQSEVGTLTIFLVDTPVGTEPALPAIQAAIEQYASAPYMKEAGSQPVDYVAIYQVEATQPAPLLPPSEYYNSVRNLFVDPLPIEAGPTALVDSLVSLLNNLESIRPNPAQFTTIVLLSDGTDVVSTQFTPDDVVRRAAELGVPIHTILLDNTAFGSSVRGAEFMAQIATSTGGMASRLSQPASFPAIWERITPFRNQTVLRYTPTLAGGDFPILLSLTAEPVIQAGARVTIPATAVYASLDVPAESQTITLPDVLEPVTLRFPATVSWVDGTARNITQAQLLVNGQIGQEIAPADIASFEATMGNLVFGANRLQLAITDELAQRAVSPPLTLTVVQGEAAVIPELLQPSSQFLGGWGVYLLACLLFLLVVGGAGLAWRRGWLAVRPRRAQVTITGGTGPNGDAPTGTFHAVRQPTFLLEVLACQTVLPATMPLTAVEVRLGRAAAHADLIFAADPTVSRLHATMVREGNSYRLFDEQSTSGTFVNGQPAPSYGALLIDGDEVHLGEVHLRFRMSEG